MPAGIMVGKWAACPSHWTSWLSGLSTYPASHLADYSNCLASWLASHLDSQLSVQNLLKHALCSLKIIIMLCVIRLCSKSFFLCFQRQKKSPRNKKTQQNRNSSTEQKMHFNYLFSFHSSLCAKKSHYHGNISCVGKSKPFSLGLVYLLWGFSTKKGPSKSPTEVL